MSPGRTVHKPSNHFDIEGYIFNIYAKCLLIEQLKGYLRYKTIASQDVSSEAQIKNFFIS